MMASGNSACNDSAGVSTLLLSTATSVMNTLLSSAAGTLNNLTSSDVNCSQQNALLLLDGSTRGVLDANGANGSSVPPAHGNANTMMEQPEGRPLTFALITVFYCLVFVVGLTGNSLVIYVVLRYSKMQTVTNMYILNLALADELFLVGLPFLITTVQVQNWVFGRVMCKLFMTSTSINQFTSSIFLTVMSADRYIAVCHPISSPKFRTPFISKVVCLTAWTVSALLMVPIFMYADTVREQSSCNIVWPGSGHMNGQTAFTLYSFILSFALPFLLILVFYTLVVRRLKTVGPRNKSKEKKRSHRKVTKLVLTVITVYVVCWLFYWISQVILIFSPSNQSLQHPIVTLFLVAGCLAYSNSAVNPILYAFLSENFKKSFIKACICAAGKEVNAQLHMENSVFPRKNRPGSEKTKTCKEPESDEDGADMEPSTAITMTSRSNNAPAVGGSEKDPMLSAANCRNGYHRHGLVASTAMDEPPTQV